MKRNSVCQVISISLFLVMVNFAAGANAQDRRSELVLPAGTLLRCSLNEPNFSSKTAEVGDPVICNLNSVLLFDRSVFPRGAYLQGHLEADKAPGHFVGKGYLRMEFDRIGLPDGQIPMPAKIVSARGQKVNGQGDIVGHGHATRDAVEWMLPPLWPVKLLMLPARGPRPTLKGEESLTLRLMDDVAIPAQPLDDAWQRFGKPSASLPRPGDALPSRYIPAKSPTTPVKPDAAKNTQTSVTYSSSPASVMPAPKQNMLVMLNGTTYETSALNVDQNQLNLRKTDGTSATVRLDDVDWTKTFEANSGSGAVLTLNNEYATRPTNP